jgi:uncharacterized protein YfiM (DUF2279 family)
MRLPACCAPGWFFVLTVSAPSLAVADALDGSDKAKHFVACTVLAGTGYGAGALLFDAPEARWLTGAGLAMGAGLGKELYDSRSGGTGFSGEDLLFDAAGTAVGLGVSFLVDHFLFQRASARAPTTALRAAAPVVARRGGGLLPSGLGLQAPRVLVGAGAPPAEEGHGGLGAALVLAGRSGEAPRLALDELHQLLPLEARVHRHHGAPPSVTAGDEHGDLASRALVHAAGGHDADLLGQAPLGERALEPARQVQTSAPRASAHEALAADEHLHLPLRVSLSAVVLHPSSPASKSRAAPLPRPADAPLRGHSGPKAP